MRFVIRLIIALLAIASFANAASAQDGYDLWLRYRPIEQSLRGRYVGHATGIVVEQSTPTIRAAASELERGLSGMLGRRIGRTALRDGAIVLATAQQIRGIGNEGYVIRSARLGGQPWIMENRPGANFVPGAEACHHAKGDGYTLCVFSTSTNAAGSLNASSGNTHTCSPRSSGAKTCLNDASNDKRVTNGRL